MVLCDCSSPRYQDLAAIGDLGYCRVFSLITKRIVCPAFHDVIILRHSKYAEGIYILTQRRNETCVLYRPSG